MSAIPIEQAHGYFVSLQNRIVETLEQIEGAPFERDPWAQPFVGAGLARYIEGGKVFERAGVLFSHTHGKRLPAAASRRHAECTSDAWEATGVSLVLHPRNPYVPITHMNVRLFVIHSSRGSGHDTFWFGGGLDLTPCYTFEDDIRHFHRVCHDAVAPFGEDAYPRLKRWCDDYFYLPHRGETRGVGGLFFDDLSAPGYDTCFALAQAVGDCFLDAYTPIVLLRRQVPFGERERAFQAYRRGRYVEFNLIHDRGTLFGLQSQGRTESILLSMPPTASWRYAWKSEAESAEAALQQFLKPRDWLASDDPHARADSDVLEPSSSL